MTTGGAAGCGCWAGSDGSAEDWFAAALVGIAVAATRLRRRRE
jgi:MYXO-CTERM domain-containing protein